MSKNIDNYNVINFTFEGDCPDRIDRVISSTLDILSREQIKELIRKGKLKVNGSVEFKPSLKVCPGDQCTLEYETADELPVAAPVDFDIIYEDTEILVINKPRGIVVHPAKGHVDDTVVSGLLYLKKELSDIEQFRPGVVHRLDMGTSGLLIIAKNNVAHRNLGDQFRDRRISKVYYALCENVPSHMSGTIDVPLAKNVQNLRIIPDRSGKESRTEFKVLKHNRNHSFIQLNPLTGRTHQLRVHMKFIGCPILGDTLYGAAPSADFPDEGFALHAGKITFYHPASGEQVTFEAELPPDITMLKERLGL